VRGGSWAWIPWGGIWGWSACVRPGRGRRVADRVVPGPWVGCRREPGGLSPCPGRACQHRAVALDRLAIRAVFYRPRPSPAPRRGAAGRSGAVRVGVCRSAVSRFSRAVCSRRARSAVRRGADALEAVGDPGVPVELQGLGEVLPLHACGLPVGFGAEGVVAGDVVAGTPAGEGGGRAGVQVLLAGVVGIRGGAAAARRSRAGSAAPPWGPVPAAGWECPRRRGRAGAAGSGPGGGDGGRRGGRRRRRAAGGGGRPARRRPRPGSGR
jgi:hypothetical protein